MRNRGIEEIRADFENAKRSGNLSVVSNLQDELFNMREGSRGGLVVNSKENTSLQRDVTDLITEMDNYISDLKDLDLEDRDLVDDSEEMEF